MDAAAASGSAAQRRRRLALHVVVGEKRILIQALNLLRDWFDIFGSMNRPPLDSPWRSIPTE